MEREMKYEFYETFYKKKKKKITDTVLSLILWW